MIYIRAELWPHGDEKKARILGEATISNTGGTLTRGNYAFVISKLGGFKPRPVPEDSTIAKVLSALLPNTRRVVVPRPSSVWRQGKVEDFARKEKNVWYLLLQALGAALIETKEKP